MFHNDKLEAKLLLKSLKVKCLVEREAVKNKMAMQRGETKNSDSVSC